MFSEFLFYFTIYAFFGWVIENVYSKITSGIFLKPNFLIGPFKPMYGFAPLLLVIFIKPGMPWYLVLALCFLIPTIVEYLTSIILLKLFNRRYWDYRNNRYNLNGHICLMFSLSWILLTLIFLYFVHPFMISTYQDIEILWDRIDWLILIYFSLETIYTNYRHIINLQFNKQ